MPKKKLIIVIVSVASLLLIIFTPIPKNTKLSNGNAFSLTSLTYKVIFWDMYKDSDKPYNKTKFLLVPNNFKSTHSLWDKMYTDLKSDGYGAVTMYVTTTKKDKFGITVTETFSLNGNESNNICYIDKSTFEKVCKDITFGDLSLGRTLIISYDGEILESYPAQFNKIFKITSSDIATTIIEDNNNDDNSSVDTDSVKSDTQGDTQNESIITSSSIDSLEQSSISSSETNASQQDNSSIDLPLHKPKGFWYQNVHKYPEHYDQKSKLLMPYLVVEPENYDPNKKYPVILYFHGAGDGYPKREDDEYEYQLRFNQRQAFQFIDGYIYCYEWLDQAIIIMPQLNNGNWWNFYPEEDGPLDAAMRIFNKVTTEFSCDSSRYYVMGPSMGGYATMEVAAKYNNIFAAAMPSCAAWTCTQEKAEQLKDIPILFLHGTSDNIVYHSRSEQNYELIKSKGNTKASIKLYDGADHDLWRYSLKDDEPFEWLFSKYKQ